MIINTNKNVTEIDLILTINGLIALSHKSLCEKMCLNIYIKSSL